MFGSVPLLCIDGLQLVQSQAIIRYLAKKHRLCGDGSVEQEVKADMVSETILDWKKASAVQCIAVQCSAPPLCAARSFVLPTPRECGV